MKFSVVVPIYNSSAYIKDTLDSIKAAANCTDYEVVLVDDRSDDILCVKRVLVDYPEVVLVVKDFKTNAADSRNKGFIVAKGDYVFFLDSDDCFCGDAINRRIKKHQVEKLGVIFGVYFNDSGGRVELASLDSYIGEDFRDYLFGKKGDIRSSTISICKKYHKGTLFDSESFKHQDWIFGILAYDNNEAIGFDGEAISKLNVSRLGRMSGSFNVLASGYFLEKYLYKCSHINSFSKRNWVKSIEKRDLEAVDFFMTNYKPIKKSDLFVYWFYRVISMGYFISFSSRVVRFIRFLKGR